MEFKSGDIVKLAPLMELWKHFQETLSFTRTGDYTQLEWAEILGRTLVTITEEMQPVDENHVWIRISPNFSKDPLAISKSCITDKIQEGMVLSYPDIHRNEKIDLLDWLAASPYIIVECKGGRLWVNSDEHTVYKNGSESHYLKLLREHGITSEKLIEIYESETTNT